MTITYQTILPLPLSAVLEPNVSPADYLQQVLAYVADLDERPAPDYVRHVAALEEAITYPEDAQQRRYDDHCKRLLSGAPIAKATPTELRRDALALFGLARDRDINGCWSLPAEAWLIAADTALATYRRPLPVAA